LPYALDALQEAGVERGTSFNDADGARSFEDDEGNFGEITDPSPAQGFPQFHL